MLEEIVTVVDASSREAVLELSKSLGISNFPVPSFLRALSPELSDNDKQMVQQIRVLVQFLLGDFEGALKPSGETSTGWQQARQMFGNSGSNNRLRQLIPVVREYAPDLRQYGSLLLVRLSEKSISRGLNWASTRLA